MSLISDALKKARQEAARQDSLRQGMPYAIGVADAPVRRAPRISLQAGLGAGCLLAAVVFAVAFFAGWGPFHKPVAATQVAAAPAAPIPTAVPVAQMPAPAALPSAPPETPQSSPAPAKPVPETPRQTDEPGPAPRIETPSPPPVPRKAAPETAPAAPAPTSTPAPAAEAPESVAAAPSPPPAAAPATGSGGLVDGQTYAGEVPVPGGGSVKLNGIVFSSDQPIAVLDGRVMGPGEVVQGFTILAIESGRVKLQGHGATVYLSSK
jgi:hypothetical protein